MSIILTKNFLQLPVTRERVGEENFAGAVKDRVTANRRSYDFIYIVPTRRRVRELQRELIKDSSFGKLPVYTLELFAQEIFSLMKIGRRIISPSMQGMIVARILSDRDLKFFRYSSSRSTPAGTIKKIVDQIDYLRENGIASEDYKQMVAAADNSERSKLEDFSRIYKAYEDALDDELIDPAGLLSLVNRELKPSAIGYQPSADLTFFVEGFYNFKKPELEFLRILSSRKDFSFFIRLDCADTNENLFRTMTGTASELIARGFKRAEAGDKSKEEKDNSQDGRNLREYFALNLFSKKTRNAKLNLREKVYIASVRDKLREIEFVAEKIKELVKEKPEQKLDGICVASYLPQNYSHLIREVFAKYQIPANVTDRYTLDSSNVVNAILSFIDIKLTDYERGALLRAVTNHDLTIADDMSASEAGSTMYHTAALCRFERGLNRFRETISSRLEFLNNFSGQGIDADGTSETEIYRNIRILTKTMKLLDSIEEQLISFKKELAPEEFRNAVESLVSSLRIYENVGRMNVKDVSTEVVERDVRALSSFFKVLDEVVDMEAKDGKTSRDSLPLGTMVDTLRSALSLARYNVRQKHGYGVYVTSLEEMRGLEFDYVFIVGLTEGEFPTRYVPEILLPLVSQKENRERQPYLQRYLFYQAVSSFKKNLFLISAAQSDEVHLIRSSFIDELVEIADPSFIHETEANAEVTPGNQKIYNIQQLIERYPDSDLQVPASGLLPPNVPRCLTSEMERYKNNKDSEFHGRVNRPDLIDSLSGSFADRIFSSAQIESLSRCGFQFFVRRILQIAEIPEIETSLSAVERGAVLHKILFQFYDELSRSRKLSDAIQELPLLLSIGQRVLNEFGIEHELFEVEKETILGNGDVKGTLELFLTRVQAKLSEYGFHPDKFEVGFGMSKGISSEENGTDNFPAPRIGGVALRGKIDRVDSYSNPDGTLGFSIFDYKTSSVIAGHKDVVGDKISPQLILYLSVLSKIVKTGEPVGAAFISINRDKLLRSDDGADLIRFIVQTDNGELKYNPTFESKSKIAAAENYPKTMADLLKQTESFVEEKVSEARGGSFNLTKFARDRVCKFCPYSEACRIALRGESLQSEDSD